MEQEPQWGKHKGGPPASSSSSGQVPALPLTALVSGVLLFDAFGMTNSHLLGRADHCQDSENFFFALNSFFLQQSMVSIFINHGTDMKDSKSRPACINVYSFVLSPMLGLPKSNLLCLLGQCTLWQGLYQYGGPLYSSCCSSSCHPVDEKGVSIGKLFGLCLRQVSVLEVLAIGLRNVQKSSQSHRGTPRGPQVVIKH